MGHNSCQGLQNGQLNRIFELAGVLCQLRPEPIVQKRKSATVGMTSAPRKTSRRRGHGRRPSHSRAETSTQELALAKALKPSKKFSTKTSTVGSEAADKKMFCTSTGRSGTTRAPKRALNLFGFDSSASNNETIPVEAGDCLILGPRPPLRSLLWVKL
jgi:hypothetical protein